VIAEFMKLINILFEQGVLFTILLLLAIILFVALASMITPIIKEKFTTGSKKAYKRILPLFLFFFGTVIALLLLFDFPGEVEENSNGYLDAAPIPLHERYINELLMGSMAWQAAYFELLSNPLNYHDEFDGNHSSGMFALVNLDGGGIPALLIVFFDPALGGNIYGKVYSFYGSLRYHGTIDIFYMAIYRTGLSSHTGIFAQGGRSSRFSGHFYTIRDNILVHEPLWESNFDGVSEANEYIGFPINRLSDNTELVNAALQLEFDDELAVYFHVINRNNVIDVIFGHRFRFN